MNSMSYIIFTLTVLCWSGSQSMTLGGWSSGIGTDVELIENGTTYKITSMRDGMVITVLPNGMVITDEWTGRDEQKWTLVEHPMDRLCLEFKNNVVPYNDLSGFEDQPENPGMYPRPLTLNKHRIMPDLNKESAQLMGDFIPVPWQILIRNRWCLQNNGQYNQLDIDDCEYEPAPWQFWQLEITSLGQAETVSISS